MSPIFKKKKGYIMHFAVLICIILAIIVTAIAIIFSIKEHDGTIFVLLFFIGTVAIVGGLGFGLACGTATWDNTYEKITLLQLTRLRHHKDFRNK